jgi:ribose 5-phosphate isomerase B
MSEKMPAHAGDTVAIASDHAGVELKSVLAKDLKGMGFNVLDLGTNDEASVDYPDFGHALAQAVTGGQASAGVAVCGTGIGISIAANRHPGARAALVHDEFTAEMSRLHNNANILALGARAVTEDVARSALKTFFSTEFEGGRHERRVGKLG